MKNFEENLDRLEEISRTIKDPNVKLEDALKSFEEGIKLAKGMEKEIDKIEGKIQVLMNQPAASAGDSPELDLFSQTDETSGSAGAPKTGLRQ
ncbi:MAG: exodeoxyribonuclease VII small subunit [Treponema sp.]|nr:exodeoxyribonuclease VII small subunit [Treponema sp.]